MFGQKQSDGQIFIYDKALEKQIPGPWTRVELRLRNARAQALAHELAEHGDSIVPGVLKGYLVFTRPCRNKQRDRWPVQRWWLQFLGDCEKVRLTVPFRPAGGQDFAWLLRTAAPALARVNAEFGKAGITALIAEGQARIGLPDYRTTTDRTDWV